MKGLSMKSAHYQARQMEILKGTCRECGATLQLGGTSAAGYRVAAHHVPIRKGVDVSSLSIPTPNCPGSDMPPKESL